MKNLSKIPAEACVDCSAQDSYIAIDEYGIVVNHCPIDGEVVAWMENYTEHHLLITSTKEASLMVGKVLPASDQEILLL